MSSKVYLAAPLFTAAERRWNEWLASTLRGHAFEVILPQEEALKHISNGVPDYAAIFAKCLEGVSSADILLAVLDGSDVDSGTALECGYAYSRGTPIIGVRTDIRSGGEEHGMNAMLSRCCQQLLCVPAFNSVEELVGPIVAALLTIKTAPVT